MLIIGGIFEGKKWIWTAEYLRVTAIVLSLNTYYWYWHINWFSVMLGISVAAGITCVIWLTVHYILNRDYYVRAL